MINKLNTLYFSPTGTTAKVVTAVTKGISEGVVQNVYDITMPEGRKQKLSFTSEDFLVIGIPVYAGRVPEFITPYLESLTGERTHTILVCAYGNRNYDDALIELKDILQKNGFVIFAAGAFIGEHSYTSKVGTDRPDSNDLEIAEKFGKDIAEKMLNNDFSSIEINGSFPYKERKPSIPIAIVTDETCTMCGICADNCPTYAIDFTDFKQVDVLKCIKCCSCIKICPVNAKSFQNQWMNNIVKSLVDNCSAQRREPELFI